MFPSLSSLCETSIYFLVEGSSCRGNRQQMAVSQ